MPLKKDEYGILNEFKESLTSCQKMGTVNHLFFTISASISGTDDNDIQDTVGPLSSENLAPS